MSEVKPSKTILQAVKAHGALNLQAFPKQEAEERTELVGHVLEPIPKPLHSLPLAAAASLPSSCSPLLSQTVASHQGINPVFHLASNQTSHHDCSCRTQTWCQQPLFYNQLHTEGIRDWIPLHLVSPVVSSTASNVAQGQYMQLKKKGRTPYKNKMLGKTII